MRALATRASPRRGSTRSGVVGTRVATGLSLVLPFLLILTLVAIVASHDALALRMGLGTIALRDSVRLSYRTECSP